MEALFPDAVLALVVLSDVALAEVALVAVALVAVVLAEQIFLSDWVLGAKIKHNKDIYIKLALSSHDHCSSQSNWMCSYII